MTGACGSYNLGGSATTVAGATRLVARAGGIALDGGVCFPSELSIMAGVFAPD